MGGKRFRVGSIGVLFAVVVLCVAILGALTVFTARADRLAAQRYGEHVQRVCHCQMLGQKWLGEADQYLRSGGALPENTWQQDGSLGTEINWENIQLVIRLEVTPEGYEIRQWSCGARWQPEESWQLWGTDG